MAYVKLPSLKTRSTETRSVLEIFQNGKGRVMRSLLVSSLLASRLLQIRGDSKTCAYDRPT